MTQATKTVMRVGIDLGTNTTVFQANRNGERVRCEQDVVPTIVGYPKAGILPGILPHDADRLFGDEAVNYRLHLNLKWPLREGTVDDTSCCRDFLWHIRSRMDPEGECEIWAVCGAPANAVAEKIKLMRACVVGLFDRVLVIPEPFLAAMGLREEARLSDSGYIDPTRHSLIVDIGAGTTDMCLVQGYYPTPDDQVCYPVAGDAVDKMLADRIRRRWPDLTLSRVTVTQLKERYSCTGSACREAKVRLFADGKPRVIDIADMVRESCEILVPVIADGIKTLLKRCDSDSVVSILQNVILCGGGSAIQGLSEMVQQTLRNEGYEDATCRTPPDYRRLVAFGAVKIAENVRDDQWQIPM